MEGNWHLCLIKGQEQDVVSAEDKQDKEDAQEEMWRQWCCQKLYWTTEIQEGKELMVSLAQPYGWTQRNP